MFPRSRVLLSSAFSAALFLATGCSSHEAAREVTLGVDAFRLGNYQLAIDFFNYALQLDPGNPAAELNLAGTYAHQWKPGLATPENRQLLQQAIEQYNKVLMDEPKNLSALRGAAYLYLQAQDYEFARHYLQRIVAIQPDDPELYFALAEIEWAIGYKDIQSRRTKGRLKTPLYDEQPQSPQQLCAELKAADGPRIDQGLKMAQTALSKRSGYYEATLYMALLHRLKATTDCDPVAFANENRLAMIFVDRARQSTSPPQSLSQAANLRGITEVPPLALLSPPPLPPGRVSRYAKLANASNVSARTVVSVQPAQNESNSDSDVVYLAPNAADNNLIRKVGPVYPERAIAARLQGDVLLKVRISKAGHIENLQVLSGNPLLVQSATAAVKQWAYRPYVLHGAPMKVDTTISIKYRL